MYTNVYDVRVLSSVGGRGKLPPQNFPAPPNFQASPPNVTACGDLEKKLS